MGQKQIFESNLDESARIKELEALDVDFATKQRETQRVARETLEQQQIESQRGLQQSHLKERFEAAEALAASQDADQQLAPLDETEQQAYIEELKKKIHDEKQQRIEDIRNQRQAVEQTIRQQAEEEIKRLQMEAEQNSKESERTAEEERKRLKAELEMALSESDIQGQQDLQARHEKAEKKLLEERGQRETLAKQRLQANLKKRREKMNAKLDSVSKENSRQIHSSERQAVETAQAMEAEVRTSPLSKWTKSMKMFKSMKNLKDVAGQSAPQRRIVLAGSQPQGPSMEPLLSPVSDVTHQIQAVQSRLEHIEELLNDLKGTTTQNRTIEGPGEIPQISHHAAQEPDGTMVSSLHDRIQAYADAAESQELLSYLTRFEVGSP